MNIAKRAERIAFMEVNDGAETVLSRMTGFTALSHKSNPQEYERQYVDELFKSTSVTGYSPEMEFEYDYDKDSLVSKKLTDIADGEKTGIDAEVYIVQIDKTQESTTPGEYLARRRKYTVVSESWGDGVENLQFKGKMKVSGETETGTGTISEDGKTATFTKL